METTLEAIKSLLAAFFTERSCLLFKLVEAGSNWLHQHASTWMQDPSYQYLWDLELQVVNDAAQRATIDVAEYAEMTRDPVYWDDIILVANGHRGRDAPH